MHNTIFMHVFDAFKQLLHQPFGLIRKIKKIIKENSTFFSDKVTVVFSWSNNSPLGAISNTVKINDGVSKKSCIATKTRKIYLMQLTY